MGKNRRLIRRTFLQERFEILISRQKRGIATFNELTELDELVNRNALIREQVLEEMQHSDPPEDEADEQSGPETASNHSFHLLSVLRSWWNRFFLKSGAIPKIIIC